MDLMITNPIIKGLSPKVFHGHVAQMGVTLFKDTSVQWE